MALYKREQRGLLILLTLLAAITLTLWYVDSGHGQQADDVAAVIEQRRARADSLAEVKRIERQRDAHEAQHTKKSKTKKSKPRSRKQTQEIKPRDPLGEKVPAH